MSAEAVAAEAYKLAKSKLDAEGRKAVGLIDDLMGGHGLNWALATAIIKNRKMRAALQLIDDYYQTGGDLMSHVSHIAQEGMS